jgi:hypothetical protein
MKYYIAALHSKADSPLGALISMGITEERAQTMIVEASINKSEAIVIAGVDDDENKVLIVGRAPPPANEWLVSIGRIDHLFDTRAEAIEHSKKVKRRMRKAGQKVPKEWFVMEWIDNPTMGITQ